MPNYFTLETAEAIIKYNETHDEQLYMDKIHAPLAKLVEYIFNRYKFPYLVSKDAQADALSHIVQNFHHLKESQKSKIFGYLSITAKNWFILHNNKQWKALNRDVPDFHVSANGDETEFLKSKDDTDLGLINLYVDFWTSRGDLIFKRDIDRRIYRAIIGLFDNYEKVPAMHKKAMFRWIRENHNIARTHRITIILGKMKRINKVLKRHYRNDLQVNFDHIIPAK